MEGKALVSTQSTTVLQPGAEDAARKFGLDPRLSDRKGKTVGLIDHHQVQVFPQVFQGLYQLRQIFGLIVGC